MSLRRNSKFKIQNANSAPIRFWVVLHFAFCILHCGAPAAAQDLVGRPLVEIVVEQEGQPVTDATILDLIQTRVGPPLSMADVRPTVDHLLSLRRYDDVRPIAEPAPGGVRLRYVLVPSHPIDTIRFTGNVSLSESDLRRLVTDRYGRLPNPNRVPDMVTALQAEYRRRGYPGARISEQVTTTHDPHRSILTFSIDAGRRARIADVTFRHIDASEADVRFPLPEVRTGELYDELKVQEVCTQWEERMRAQGFYEASASCFAPQADEAFVFVNVRRGPLVVVEFSGDPLPVEERERLVPIRAEASTDEDLLEDAELAIERYLHARGYRDAQANRSRDDTIPGQLTIRFQVMRGPRYTIDSVRIMGNSAISTAELEKILTVRRGDLFIASMLEAQRAAIQAAYIERGFRRAAVKTDAPSLPNDVPDSPERRVEVILAIDEGPRTNVRSVVFKGNTVFTETQLRGVDSVPVVDSRYLAQDVTAGRDAIAIRYQNQGYLDVSVRDETTFADNDTYADITYTIVEGTQAIIEHIIIVGNDKTKTETILEELEFQEGGPLGRAAQVNSRTRLARLGLFRQVTFSLLEHPGDSRRDVLIEIQEADRTTLGYSFGLEGTLRARPTGPGGAAEDHLELAPRGGFEIGRRNLFGTNRSVNLFTRVSLRSTDVRSSDPASGGQTESNPGFNEYRVVGSFREPRFFSNRSDLLITGIVEQAIRTTFNFSRRIARAEVATSVTPEFSVTGRYTFERTKLFDEQFADDEQPLLIDKLFPQVRLSKFAGSLIYDTRDDLLDPSQGISFLWDTDVAMRAIGSEVGFVRTFAQAYLYRQLPVRRRTIVAFGARLGTARGFERIKDDQAVSDLPASERFFAGGDTTVRGFSLDRLVDDDTVSPTGFPLGGNGVVILNGELRVHLGKALHGVGFVDAGTVSKFASDLSLADLRPAAGAGLRIESPFGPIRFDLGVNLDPRDFTGVSRERRTVFHISIGQAF